MKKQQPNEQHSAEARAIWRRFCTILDATERQYASHIMPILVDLYRRHERVCGHETQIKAAREDVVFLYQIHHIDDFGPKLAAQVRKVMRDFELKQALRKKFRLIKGGLKGNHPKSFRGALRLVERVS